MRKTNSGAIKLYRYITILLLGIFLISAFFFFLNLWEKKSGKFTTLKIDEPVIEYNGKEYELKKNIQTFLVLGLDKFDVDSNEDSYNNNKQADLIMLFILDNDAKACSAIQINRDTMTKINILGVAGNRVDTVTKQIALAHTYGNGREVSCRNTSDAVSELLLGIKIDHYISVTMDSVPVFNDLLGGVEVTVLDDFTGIDETLVKGKKVTLLGEHSLNYVRSRYGIEDSTNSTRMKRQQQYMNAMYDKVLECVANDDNFIVESTVKMSNYIVSDRTVTQLQELLKKLSTYKSLGIKNIEGESKVGEKFMEFHADKQSIEELVINSFYQIKE